jgi:hypothetical protein
MNAGESGDGERVGSGLGEVCLMWGGICGGCGGDVV